MRLTGDSGADWRDASAFALGAIGGLAVGMLLYRVLPRPRGLGQELRERARVVGRRLRPARMHRLATEQEGLDRLEEAVLDTFLADSTLGERGIDIGAISPGIIELSGTVWTQAEAHRAISLANRVAGVRSVVNRLEVEGTRRSMGRDDLGHHVSRETFGHHESRVGGMGRRRQGSQTDPDQPDDSQLRKERALAEADRQQWEEERCYLREPRATPSDVPAAPDVNFSEDELDNQNPLGRRRGISPDSPPQEFHSTARVGEAPKPGTRLRLESADVPRSDGSTS